MHFCRLWIFLNIFFSKTSFRNTVRVSNSSGLIWVQTVCKGRRQKPPLAGKELWEIDTFSGEAALSKLAVSLLKMMHSKQKEFAPHGNKFFLFRIDFFFFFFRRGLLCRNVNRKSQMLSPLYEIVENLLS